MRDVEALLQSTTPSGRPSVDLEALHRRGVRRRRITRVTSAGALTLVLLAAGLGVSSLVPVIEGPEVAPVAPAPADITPPASQDAVPDEPAAPEDEVSAEEREVQDCMEQAGLRYDLVADVEPPTPAYVVTPAHLLADDEGADQRHERRAELVQRYGWLGYERAMNEAGTSWIHDTEPSAAHQEHFMAAVEHEARRRAESGGDAVALHDLDLYTDYLDALTDCQGQAYGYQVWSLDQHRLVENVLAHDWTSALTTGRLGQEPAIDAAWEELRACRPDEEALRRRLDDLAEAAGLVSPPSDGALDPDMADGDPGAGWSLHAWSEVDPFTVPGFEEFADESRSHAERLLECERDYLEVEREVAAEIAPDYLASRADELREAGIEVDLGPDH